MIKAIRTLGLAAVAGLASSAGAGVLTSTGFEASEGYTTGNLVNNATGVGQNGWTGFAADSLGQLTTPNFTVVNNPANAYQGSQYVQFNTASFSNDSTSNTSRAGFAWVDQTVSAADLAANPVVHVSSAIRMNSPTGTRSNFGLVSLWADGGSYNMCAFGLYSSASGAANSYIFVGAQDVGGGLIFPTGSPNTGWLNTWIVFDLYADYSTGLWSLSVNGVSIDADLDANAFDRTFDTSRIFSDADFDAERARPASGSSSGGATIWYDNYLVELVPAPGSAALLGLGGLAAARRRRS